MCMCVIIITIINNIGCITIVNIHIICMVYIGTTISIMIIIIIIIIIIIVRLPATASSSWASTARGRSTTPK